MVLVATDQGTSTHSGSVCAGVVAGTLDAGSNTFVSIESELVMVDDGTMEIPSHLNPPCTPGTPLAHSYSPDTLAQGSVTVDGEAMVLIGDSFSGDATEVDGAGINTFVQVT